MKSAPLVARRFTPATFGPARDVETARGAEAQSYRIAGEMQPIGAPRIDASVLPRKHLLTMSEGVIAGFEKPLVASTVLAVMALPSIVHAAPLDGTPVGAPVSPATPGAGDTTTAGAVSSRPQEAPVEYQQAMRELDQRFEAGRLSQADLAKARRMLTDAFVNGKRDVVIPRDFRGRIDVNAVITQAVSGSTTHAMTRGEAVMTRLTNELDRRMRVTARDMADPNTRFIEGAPGYKEIPAGDVQKLLLDAVQDIPLNELQGGEQIARLVRQIPNAEGLDAEHMSLREILSNVGQVEREWLKSRIQPLIAGHELEVGVTAFAAMTGLRAASPEAAGFIDRLHLRTTIYRHSFDEGRIDARASAIYRDRHVLPDVNVTVSAMREVAPGTTLRATVGGTLSVEARDLMTGTATIGAHHTEGNWNVNASGTYYSNTSRLRTNVTVGHYDPDSRLNASGSLTAMFGDGVSVGGKANGRATLEVNLTKDLKLGNGVTGEAGFYAGGSVDTDGSHPDARVGAVLRLRW